MRVENPIRRRFRGRWTSPFHGTPQPIREWFAVCQECGAEIVGKRTWPNHGRPSRKSTKDDLYRHTQEHHKPGLVGRG